MVRLMWEYYSNRDEIGVIAIFFNGLLVFLQYKKECVIVM